MTATATIDQFGVSSFLEGSNLAMFGRRPNQFAAVTQDFARWFGAFNSTPKYPDMDWRPETPVVADDICAAVTDGALLSRNPASRLVFIAQGPATLTLFADGESFECEGETTKLAQDLCALDSIVIDPALAEAPAAVALLTTLCNMGCIAFESDE